MSEVRKFRWLTNQNNKVGYGPNDGFDYDVATQKVYPVKHGERFGQDHYGLMQLLGLLPDLEVLERWVANPDDDFSEVTA